MAQNWKDSQDQVRDEDALMQPTNDPKADAVADFAVSVYTGADSAALARGRGCSREALALEIAADGTEVAGNRGILPPKLRERLERMTQDYAEILKRIDRIRVQTDGVAGDGDPPRPVC